MISKDKQRNIRKQSKHTKKRIKSCKLHKFINKTKKQLHNGGGIGSVCSGIYSRVTGAVSAQIFKYYSMEGIDTDILKLSDDLSTLKQNLSQLKLTFEIDNPSSIIKYKSTSLTEDKSSSILKPLSNSLSKTPLKEFIYKCITQVDFVGIHYELFNYTNLIDILKEYINPFIEFKYTTDTGTEIEIIANFINNYENSIYLDLDGIERLFEIIHALLSLKYENCTFEINNIKYNSIQLILTYMQYIYIKVKNIITKIGESNILDTKLYNYLISPFIKQKKENILKYIKIIFQLIENDKIKYTDNFETNIKVLFDILIDIMDESDNVIIFIKNIIEKILENDSYINILFNIESIKTKIQQLNAIDSDSIIKIKTDNIKKEFDSILLVLFDLNKSFTIEYLPEETKSYFMFNDIKFEYKPELIEQLKVKTNTSHQDGGQDPKNHRTLLNLFKPPFKPKREDSSTTASCPMYGTLIEYLLNKDTYGYKVIHKIYNFTGNIDTTNISSLLDNIIEIDIEKIKTEINNSIESFKKELKTGSDPEIIIKNMIHYHKIEHKKSKIKLIVDKIIVIIVKRILNKINIKELPDKLNNMIDDMLRNMPDLYKLKQNLLTKQKGGSIKKRKTINKYTPRNYKQISYKFPHTKKKIVASRYNSINKYKGGGNPKLPNIINIVIKFINTINFDKQGIIGGILVYNNLINIYSTYNKRISNHNSSELLIEQYINYEMITELKNIIANHISNKLYQTTQLSTDTGERTKNAIELFNINLEISSKNLLYATSNTNHSNHFEIKFTGYNIFTDKYENNNISIIFHKNENENENLKQLLIKIIRESISLEKYFSYSPRYTEELKDGDDINNNIKNLELLKDDLFLYKYVIYPKNLMKGFCIIDCQYISKGDAPKCQI